MTAQTKTWNAELYPQSPQQNYAAETWTCITMDLGGRQGYEVVSTREVCLHRGVAGAMRVSTRGDYACRALLSLALHGGDQPTSVRDIAERTGLPQPYLEQILLALKGAGIVRSKRGVGGGYVLARLPDRLTLGQVVAAVDGPIVVGDFGEPHVGEACNHEGQCALLSVWAEVGDHMRLHLDSFTIADMVERVSGKALTPIAEPVTQ